MGVFEQKARERWQKEGADKPVPYDGAARYLFLLKNHFWKLIALNLLFIVCALPIVTLPASLCGINRVLIKLIHDGNCLLWQEFKVEFKSSFVKSLPLGVLYGGGVFVAWYLLSLSFTNGNTLFGMLFAALGISVSLLTLLMGGWTFVLVAMLPLPNGAILKNARALAVLTPVRSIGVMATSTVMILFAIFLMPLSLLPLTVFFVSFAQYTICFLVHGAADAHIIRPYEAQK